MVRDGERQGLDVTFGDKALEKGVVAFVEGCGRGVGRERRSEAAGEA